ncbi:MAG: glycosyltransferase family 4 protein [Deltaproteobacteria bacterium]|nr:glycosyltransferase family 4 protein [Deltaproteobacteria bacterium]
MKRIAVVCPDDLSVVLFCKGIIDDLRNRKQSEVYVISEEYGENTGGYYSEIIRSWGVHQIPLRMDRHIDPLEDMKYMFSLYRLFKQLKIDTVVNISTKPNIYGTIAARLAGIEKSLCSVWGRGTAFIENNGVTGNILRILLLSLYSISFRLSTKVWFTNINDYNYFIAHRTVPRHKTILTKNYVNADEYRPYTLPKDRLAELREDLDLNGQDKMVIMVGRMIWAKGVGEFIMASKILAEKLPNVKFILVGPEETTSPDAVPAGYLRESDSAANFKWVGFRKDVKDLYAISDLAVLPSYYREGGYPRALTEPMAMGKPVIAADSEDCRSPVENGKNGYLVPIKNARALADAIEELMLDDGKRDQFGQYSRVKVKREYDEKVIVKEVIDAFLEN